MLIAGALMVIFCKAKPNDIISASVFRAGMMGVVTVFGLAWMSDTWIANNLPYIKETVASVVSSQPYLFALALFFVSASLSVKITFATLSVLHGVVKHAIFAGVYR